MPESFFDFKSVSEEKDELDYNNLSDCPHCKKPIPQDATMCYYCGGEVYFNKKSHKFFWLVLILIVFLFIYLVF